jgi:hypothetical protein
MVKGALAPVLAGTLAVGAACSSSAAGDVCR